MTIELSSFIDTQIESQENSRFDLDELADYRADLGELSGR